jgi:large subunit ribosomal protein L10
MKKLGLLVKEVAQNRIKDTIAKSNSLIIIKYSGVSSPAICSLRQTLHGVNATLFVVRNNVAKRTLKEIGREDLAKSIDGPCGFVFMNEEPVGVSKVLCDFVKTNENLKVEGGFLQDRTLTKKDIEALSKLPSKDVLRAQVVTTLKAPIFNIVIVLNQTLAKFVYCLEQIKNKKAG